MRWTLVATLAAALTGAGMTAPAARAHDDDRSVFLRVDFGSRAPRCAVRYEIRVERVIVREGFWREEIVPATFGVRFDFGCRRFVRVVVRPASVVRTWVSPVIEERVVRVVVPAPASACVVFRRT